MFIIWVLTGHSEIPTHTYCFSFHSFYQIVTLSGCWQTSSNIFLSQNKLLLAYHHTAHNSLACLHAVADDLIGLWPKQRTIPIAHSVISTGSWYLKSFLKTLLTGLLSGLRFYQSSYTKISVLISGLCLNPFLY